MPPSNQMQIPFPAPPITRSSLTPRTRQIVELRKSGLSFREIGDTLGITARAAKAHMQRVAIALGLRGQYPKTNVIVAKLYPAEPDPQKLALLSPRQKQVALGVFAAKTNREIGTEIGISEQEVKNFLTRTFDKIGAFNRVELRELLSA